MPVPTETFRSITKLNAVFALSAVALLGSVLWLVVDDYNREFRHWQRDSRQWQIALTHDRKLQASSQDTVDRIEWLRRQQEAIRSELARGEMQENIQTIQERKAELTATRDKLSLPTATLKGQIVPFQQQIQEAKLATPPDETRIAELVSQLRDVSDSYRQNNEEMVGLENNIDELQSELDTMASQLTLRTNQLNAVTRQLNSLEEQLRKLDPQKLLAKVGDKVRDAPLLDWLNPSEKPLQIVVPDVLTDLNMYQIETIDRCQSCHVKIDDPAFSEPDVLHYAERQVAVHQEQDIHSIGQLAPVVKLDFWLDAVLTVGPPLSGRLDEAVITAIDTLNEFRSEADQDELPELDKPAQRVEQVRQELEEVARLPDDPASAVRREQWYRPRVFFQDDLKRMLQQHLGDEQFGLVEDLYRHELLGTLNEVRRNQDPPLPELNSSSVMLAHPDLNLYVNAESAHPMKTMGCTVCHEGSGQEMIFEHTAHTPRHIWVDAKTGAAVPDFLIEQVGTRREIDHHRQESQVATAPHDATIVMASLGGGVSHQPQPSHGQHDDHLAMHSGVNLTDPDHPAPLAPVQDPHGDTALYRIIGRGGDEPLGIAIRQEAFWKKKYGWAHVHYMHWEKPMHELEHVESSCNKCHREIFDIKDEAPRLFEGRRLFAHLGCINCHAVTELEDDLDLRQIGPSLVHLKHKLSESMAASWIWAPKAFRPTTRMPHYFMLENNSAPVDILRTRIEVAAIAYYLMNAEPGTADTTAYDPRTPPSEPGDPEEGRKLFHQVGCLACHSNLNEHGRQWITQDLVDRKGLDEDQAAGEYEQMSYNQRHWYVQTRLPDKLQQTGPELSAVGSKLLEGRTDEQARAWLYDWLVNPRNYHGDTIMPSLRLSAQEAADLTEYLLQQTRDDYTADDFALDARGVQMLEELIVTLLGSQSTPKLAREELQSDSRKWSIENQFMYLGQKMISHYGCAGCHQINGFEEAVSACTRLDGWGLKDPHKLDYGNYEHAFEEFRESPRAAWMVDRHGLTPDAPQIESDSPRINHLEVAWEHISNERRPWLYHKLHNTRVYDRGRSTLDGALMTESIDVGKPYDKLKMPRFFLRDDQVRALITYVTSIRKPLVRPNLQQVTDDAAQRVTRGRQIATRYNCYGCHNIEGNDVHVHQYFGVYNEDGTYNDDALNWAPPRLIGQGAKTQPQWLFSFLQNVQKIRPWLRMRMPSFNLTGDEARTLVDYFAGHAQVLSRRNTADVAAVQNHLTQITDQIDALGSQVDRISVQSEPLSTSKKAPEVDVATHAEILMQEKQDLQSQIGSLQDQMDKWFEADGALMAQAVRGIRAFGTEADLVIPEQLDPRYADNEERMENWDNLVQQVRVLGGVYETDYPYIGQLRPDEREADPRKAETRFQLAEKLFIEMQCMAGQCHRVGDDNLLAARNMLVATSMEDMADDDDDEWGDDEGYDDEGYGEEDTEEWESVPMRPDGPPGGAPNLWHVAERLQSDWVNRWMVHAMSIQPGTRMQQYFEKKDTSPNGSYFASMADPDEQARKEALFGSTGEEQKSLLLDYLYSVGPRRITLSPIGDRLAADTPTIELKPGPPASPAPVVAADEAEQPDADTLETSTPAEPESEELADDDASPTVSKIEAWHDVEKAPYVGEMSQGNRTRIIGTITFTGQRQRSREINMEADSNCVLFHDTPAFSEEQVIGDEGQLANALIHVVEGLPQGMRFDPPSPAEIHQTGCVYEPHITAVMVGQNLSIWNDDDTAHNVRIMARNNKSENFLQPAKGVNHEKKFNKKEMGISLKCDVHPWMLGHVHVLDHPFFSVSDGEGRFEIRGLPPGQYTFQVLHESRNVATSTFDAIVEANTSHRVEEVVLLGQ